MASEAGVGRVTLYGHFPSREDLLEAVVRRALAEVNDLVHTDGFETGPADEVLGDAIRTSWRKMERYRRLRRVAQDELAWAKKRCRPVVCARSWVRTAANWAGGRPWTAPVVTTTVPMRPGSA